MKMFLDGSGSEFYMAYYRPIRNGQGMAVTGDRAFVLHDTGVCAVLDLISKDPRPVSVFPLGSYNAGKPSREYLNHANSCMFGAVHWGNNPIPLLYVTIGAGIGSDEDGFVTIEGNKITGVKGKLAGITVSTTYEEVTYSAIVRVNGE